MEGLLYRAHACRPTAYGFDYPDVYNSSHNFLSGNDTINEAYPIDVRRVWSVARLEWY
jgi:hypothetical protein